MSEVHDIERAFQVLESYGVPRERARSVSNGIGVLATRMQRGLAERDALLARNAELKAAIRAFVAKHDALEPALTNAFLMEQIHGRPYRGDNWATELATMRALAALDAEQERTT